MPNVMDFIKRLRGILMVTSTRSTPHSGTNYSAQPVFEVLEGRLLLNGDADLDRYGRTVGGATSVYDAVRYNYVNSFLFDGLSANERNDTFNHNGYPKELTFSDQTLSMGYALLTFSSEAD